MRLRLFAIALILALPAAAETQTPRQMMVELGAAPSDEDLARSIEQARGHPLGSRQNPVRVSGVEGEHAYMHRLRCGDGNAPRIGQRANIGVGVFGSIVDLWQLDCGDPAPGSFSLALDMYHDDHDETQAPAGLTLAPR
ncbi:MAG TPA: hypothetical protein VGO55_15075 [Allosphingosinicella sp.]|jgi:hypothetical protein|nr:hypothetical protein [Allosphingosinicella sp.]